MSRYSVGNPYYKTRDKLTIDTADLSTWGSRQGTGTVTIESSTDYVRENDQSIHFLGGTGTGNNYYTKNLDVAHNFSVDGPLLVSFYLPSIYYDSVNTFKIFLSDAANLATGTGRIEYVIDGTGKSLFPGWNLLPLDFSDFSTTDGVPTDALTYVSARLRLDGLTTNGLDREVYFDGFIKNYRAIPQVLVTFDDGTDTSYTIGHTYAQTKNIKLTHYIIHDVLDTAGFLTTSQMLDMQANGDTLGLHDGGANWPTYGADLQTHIKTIKDALVSKGADFSQVLTASWPQGDIGKQEKNWDANEAALAANGVKFCRGSFKGVNYPYAGRDLMQYGVSLNNTTTLQQAKDWVNWCVKTGSTLIFYGHHIRATVDSVSWSQSDYEALIDFLADYRAKGLITMPSMPEYVNNLQTGNHRRSA